jgi:hypothetical protein
MVALKSRGYHVKGTMIVRPSARSTASVSSVTCTSRTRSPELRYIGSVHAISPTKDCDSPPLAGGLAEAPPDRSQDFWPAQPGPARTLPTDRRDPHGHGEAHSAHGCENTCGMAPPSVWLARLSVSHRRAADSRCTVVNPLPGAADGTETRQAPLSSTLGDFRRVLHPAGTDRSHFRESTTRPFKTLSEWPTRTKPLARRTLRVA